MVSINPNSRNVQAKLLKTDATKNTGEPEKLEKTTGNNTGAGPKIGVQGPCLAIHNLHYNAKNELCCKIDSEEDYAALQIIANESGRVVNFERLDNGQKGRVTPD